MSSTRASELDPSTGLLKSSDPSAILIGFEDADQLSSLGVTLIKTTSAGRGAPPMTALLHADGTPMTADELTAHTAQEPAVEGSKALLLGAGPTDGANGILIPWAKLASHVTAQKVQITVWVRTYGITPTFTATYSASTTLPAAGSFSSVVGIRTGRETSDGWAELTTGPIDTSVWGVPLAQITMGASGSDVRRNPNASMVIDALEILPVAGTPLPASACTIATQDKACGADGECQFGHCLPAYASWGPTPSAAHRADFVDRWIALAKYVHGARNVAGNAAAMVAARPTLTAANVGGRQFFAGLMGLVNGLRNHHTSFDSPGNFGNVQPLVEGRSSSTLGACAGFGDLDLLKDSGDTSPKLGFILYKVAASSPIGASLKVGDAITKIDGIDPLTWVRSVFLTYSPGVPADPEADLAWSAASVAWMISHRASTVEITRCASATDCTGPNRTVQTIDVATPTWNNIQGTGLMGNENDPNILDCSERFQDAIADIPASNGGDTFTARTVGDTVVVQFDGTLADFAEWESSVVSALSASPAPTKVLFDVRQGNGGFAENSEVIAEEIRDPSQPIGQIGFSVAAWDQSDTVAGLLGIVGAASPSCEMASAAQGAPCDLVDGYYFLGDYMSQVGALEQLTPFTPGSTGARVAWLHAADVSANDYLAGFIEGRANQRIFSPGPTSGSYGTISSVASSLLGWHAGSIQMTDSIWGTDRSTMASQPFRSGVGVPPDEILAQKMSDAINGVDTMLAAARAWLGSTETP